MSAESTIEQLQRDVQYLKDRLEIQDVIMRHCRGVDRHDAELLSSCYHPDALVKHGNSDKRIKGPEYGEWSNGAHDGRFGLHSHGITNINIEIDGDVAYCESYVITFFLTPDMKKTALVSGRYYDQFEKRDGGPWKIAKRKAWLDIAADADASYLGNYRGQPIDHDVFWTKADPSYEKPIDLDSPSPQWT